MRRPAAYTIPAEHQIYNSSGRLISIGSATPPEHLRAKPDAVANWIAAGLIAGSFGATVLSIYALCLAVKWVVLLIGGVS